MNIRYKLECAIGFALLASVGSSCFAKPPQRAAPIVAVEREFAAYAAQNGWISAFRTYSAPDGVVIAKGQIRNARALFGARPESGSKTLKWWPAVALISRSGDLGFTTGPYTVDDTGRIQGQYFTVWKLQPDKRWRWIFDGGTGTEEPTSVAREGAVAEFMTSANRRTTAKAAIAKVTAIEEKYNAARVLIPFLAQNVRILRADRPPSTGAAAQTEMSFPSHTIAYERADLTFASKAGDIVFTLGPAHWENTSGSTIKGHFARVWQATPNGWQIVFDELLPSPPESPAS
ncbi:hypothetical protein [Aquisediminimonas profunda]|uniref:hypothetical protein n=1 Tax=Aquisediminimonas profunda TaxID=1550733 RepID=UPI001C63460A|nr:hypothetical protein [Aquisediminimonas profunda]